jgi:hypothetical protein
MKFSIEHDCNMYEIFRNITFNNNKYHYLYIRSYLGENIIKVDIFGSSIKYQMILDR